MTALEDLADLGADPGVPGDGPGAELVDAAGRGSGPGLDTAPAAVVGTGDVDRELDYELSAAATALVAEALAPNTRRAYRRWGTRWDTWCVATGRTALPGTAASLASWVAELVAEGQSPASIGQGIAAIRSAHDPGRAPRHPRPGPGREGAAHPPPSSRRHRHSGRVRVCRGLTRGVTGQLLTR